MGRLVGGLGGYDYAGYKWLSLKVSLLICKVLGFRVWAYKVSSIYKINQKYHVSLTEFMVNPDP